MPSKLHEQWKRDLFNHLDRKLSGCIGCEIGESQDSHAPTYRGRHHEPSQEVLWTCERMHPHAYDVLRGAGSVVMEKYQSAPVSGRCCPELLQHIRSWPGHERALWLGLTQRVWIPALSGSSGPVRPIVENLRGKLVDNADDPPQSSTSRGSDTGWVRGRNMRGHDFYSGSPSRILNTSGQLLSLL